MSELDDFISTILPKIGEECCSKIKAMLSSNNFTSRLSLKLLDKANLDVLFADLPLGSRKVLEYQLNLLSDESPLHVKGRQRKTCTEQDEANAEGNDNNDSDNQSSKRAFEQRRLQIETQIEENELSLSELQVNLDSMNINVPALPAIGNGKVTCGNCHHRGHRNQVNQPCELQKCTSYTYCGIRDKHPEYFAEMNRLKTTIKKKRDDMKSLQEQLTGIKNFVSQSEHHFLKALTPRMMKVDPSYKINKQKLLRDIRILRKFYNGKIPQETTNDAEQLRISLCKCKQKLEHEIGDVAVHGIQQYEQMQCSEGKNAINLNVTMSVSPESTNTVSNSSVSDTVQTGSHTSHTIVQETDRKLKSGRARKLKFKRKLKSKYKSKKGSKDYSSSSSESESQSESCSSSSSTSEENRKVYISKSKRKRKLKHNRSTRNAERYDVYSDRAGSVGEINLQSMSSQNFMGAPTYRQTFTPQQQAQMMFPSTSYPLSSGTAQNLPGYYPYNYAMGLFPCAQWPYAGQTLFTNKDPQLHNSSSNAFASASSLESQQSATTFTSNNNVNTCEGDGLSLLSSVANLANSDKQS